MRSDLAEFELAAPKSLDEALRRLDAEPGVWRPLAGGTDVMVLLSSGKLSHKKWIDVWGLDELRGIEVSDRAVTFGALTTYADVQRHDVVARELPMLAQAGRETGGVAIQNRGTLGGNVANASPAADSPPALLAYGAEIELASARGRRWIDYARFHTGYKQTVMEPAEIISRIRVPRVSGDRVHFYRKVGPRRAQAISKVCFAGCGCGRDARIALGGVAPVVVRCIDAERAIAVGDDADRVRDAMSRAISPIDDVRSTARYRRRVSENLLLEFLGALAEGW